MVSSQTQTRARRTDTSEAYVQTDFNKYKYIQITALATARELLLANHDAIIRSVYARFTNMVDKSLSPQQLFCWTQEVYPRIEWFFFK